MVCWDWAAGNDSIPLAARGLSRTKLAEALAIAIESEIWQRLTAGSLNAYHLTH